MALDPVLQQLLDQIPEMPAGPVNYPEIRAMAAQFIPLLVGPGGPIEVDSVEPLEISGPGGPVPLRIYRPSGEPKGTMHYIHGGGWSIGDLPTIDHTARRLCQSLSMTIVTSTYRLAPEHPFPAAFDDSLAAARWVLQNVETLGGSAKPCIIAGDSAGGNLAAAVCLALRDGRETTFDAQLLLYPAVDLRLEAGSYASREADADPSLRLASVLGSRDSYLGDADGENPLLSPLVATDLSRLPPALVVVLSVDPLRDEGVEYARRLNAAGVEARLIEFDNLTHGFVHFANLVPAAAQATGEVLAGLKALLDGESDDRTS